MMRDSGSDVPAQRNNISLADLIASKPVAKHKHRIKNRDREFVPALRGDTISYAELLGDNPRRKKGKHRSSSRRHGEPSTPPASRKVKAEGVVVDSAKKGINDPGAKKPIVVILEYEGVLFSDRDYGRLGPEEYITDNIADLYFLTIMRGVSGSSKMLDFSPERRAQVLIFSALNFRRVLKHYQPSGQPSAEYEVAFNNMLRWGGRRTNIFKFKVLMFPIGGSGHWSLAIVYNVDNMRAPGDRRNNSDQGEKTPVIVCVDSLRSHPHRHIANILRQYLAKRYHLQHKTLQNTVYTESDIPLTVPNSPEQDNGTDCGVFMIEAAETLLQAWPEVTRGTVSRGFDEFIHRRSFSQNDIEAKRVHIKTVVDGLKEKYDALKKTAQEKSTVVGEDPDVVVL